MNESDKPNGETLYSRATFLRDLITREDWQNAHNRARSLMVALAEVAGSALREEWPTPEAIAIRAETARVRGGKTDAQLATSDHETLERLRRAEEKLYAAWVESLLQRQNGAAVASEPVTYVQAQPQPQQPKLELDARAVDEVVRRLAGIVEDRVQMVRPLLEHIERRQGDLANEVFKLAELIRAPRKSTAETLGAAIAAGRDQTAPGVTVFMTGPGGGGGAALASAKATPYAPKAAGGPVASPSSGPAPRRNWWRVAAAVWSGLCCVACGLAFGVLLARVGELWLHW